VKHSASPKFWAAYDGLPPSIRKLADANFAFLKRDPRHRPFNSKRSGDIDQSVSACAIEPWPLKQTMRISGSGSVPTRIMIG
jgi:hypothetical protein